VTHSVIDYIRVAGSKNWSQCLAVSSYKNAKSLKIKEAKFVYTCSEMEFIVSQQVLEGSVSLNIPKVQMATSLSFIFHLSSSYISQSVNFIKGFSKYLKLKTRMEEFLNLLKSNSNLKRLINTAQLHHIQNSIMTTVSPKDCSPWNRITYLVVEFVLVWVKN